MKLLLSVHPWVSFCAAELNMSPRSLLEEPRPPPLWSRDVRGGSGRGWFPLIASTSGSWNSSLPDRRLNSARSSLRFFRRRPSPTSFAGGSRPTFINSLCNFSAEAIPSFQQLMSEINQIRWVIRKNVLLRGVFFPLVVPSSFSLSAVSSLLWLLIRLPSSRVSLVQSLRAELVGVLAEIDLIY